MTQTWIWENGWRTMKRWKARYPHTTKLQNALRRSWGMPGTWKKTPFHYKKRRLVNKDHSTTKRNVLRQVASVFDPLGLLSPVTLQGKVLLQNLWKKRLEWDETLEAKDVDEWLEIKDDLKNIDSVDVSEMHISTLWQRTHQIHFSVLLWCLKQGICFVQYTLCKSLKNRQSVIWYFLSAVLLR